METLNTLAPIPTVIQQIGMDLLAKVSSLDYIIMKGKCGKFMSVLPHIVSFTPLVVVVILAVTLVASTQASYIIILETQIWYNNDLLLCNIHAMN